MTTSTSSVSILGTRGIPASHGGFETFAEELALFLVRQDVRVTVYCQSETSYEREWKGVHLVGLVAPPGAGGSVRFDLKSVLHARRDQSVKLILGYNTALFNLVFALTRQTHYVNMDGIEWRRRKWGRVAKTWFWFNEWIASKTCSGMIADHPAIEAHLRRRPRVRPVTMIPYGSRKLTAETVAERDAAPHRYALIIARPEPENSILEMVSAWSTQTRGARLLVLGTYTRENDYQCRVLDAASGEVEFVGPIYDKDRLDSLRFGASFYMYGHTVGGTSPTLVEALGAGNAILALDTVFSRWVAADSAVYFSDVASCSAQISALLNDESLLSSLKGNALARFEETFTWDKILTAYGKLLGVLP